MSEPSIGALLRRFRIDAGLSQEALAERARMSAAAISSLERSVRRAPQRESLRLLADALQLSAEARRELERAAEPARRRGPRAQGSSRIATSLPQSVATFIGRERELLELGRFTGERRIVTLFGPGGVGKTRLALEVARDAQRSARFSGGVAFIDLSPLVDASAILPTLWRACGVTPPPDPDIELLRALFGDERVLLVLDNCEHLIEASAAFINALTRSLANVHVLATSREALEVDGERLYRIEPLAVGLPTAAGPALDLFLDRLADADAQRYAVPTEIDRAFAATIALRLEGMPLALELAAARARDYSLAEIAARLDERFALLDRGKRDAPARQQTLRAAIDWSVALLSPPERETFVKLGVFAGAFDVAAIAAVCEDPSAAEHAAALVRKSLVVRAGDDVPVRYRLFDTVRDYTRETASVAGIENDLARRHLAWAEERMRDARSRYRIVEISELLAECEPDLNNVREALRFATLGSGDRTVGAELARNSGWLFNALRLYREGISWTSKALEAGPLPLELRAVLQHHLGGFYGAIGLLEDAVAAERAGCEAVRAAGNAQRLATSQARLAHALYRAGYVAEALKAAEEAIHLARETGDEGAESRGLRIQALAMPLEKCDDRRAVLSRILSISRAHGDAEMVSAAFAGLAETEFAANNFAAALALGRESLDIARLQPSPTATADALTNVAAYALGAGDLGQARSAAREALEIDLKGEHGPNTAYALQHLAAVAARNRKTTLAARLLGASEALYRRFGLVRAHTEATLFERTRLEITGHIGATRADREIELGHDVPLERIVAGALTV